MATENELVVADLSHEKLICLEFPGIEQMITRLYANKQDQEALSVGGIMLPMCATLKVVWL